MTAPAFDPVERGTTMLALPKTFTLTRGQLDGEECPWCGTELTTSTRVDLGVRPGPYGDPIHPWGCGTCVRARARESYARHSYYCRTCQQDPSTCDTRRVLRRLALENRR